MYWKKLHLSQNIKSLDNAKVVLAQLNIHVYYYLGGYDRIECLRSVEQYIPETNTWKTMATMREARGRFQIAILGEKVYAVGGSNGTTELDTVEMLDISVGKL